jgi:arsenate reductase
MERKKVLFVCTYHGARSRIAEEFTKQFAPGRIDAHSSCFDPFRIGPLPIEVMREAGIDLPADSPKPIFYRHREDGDIYDYVICLCHEVSTEQCPLFKKNIDVLYAKKAETISWSIPDFKTLSGTEEEKKANARIIRDMIKINVISFLAQIGIDAEIV